ncbi:hypothetical protein LDENG_00232270, partial [Lucifuga dentata]
MFELQSPDDGGGGGNVDELECKICYCTYDLRNRRPKLLDCCHRLCTKCLTKILDLGESPPNAMVCPFCRYVTRMPGEAASGLPDDRSLLSVLSLQSRNHRNQRTLQQDSSTELLLSPG